MSINSKRQLFYPMPRILKNDISMQFSGTGKPKNIQNNRKLNQSNTIIMGDRKAVNSELKQNFTSYDDGKNFEMFSPPLLNNTEEVFYKNKSPSVI